MNNNIENEVGRAFEYIIVQEIINKAEAMKIVLILSNRAREYNIRDKAHFNNLEDSLKDNLTKGAAAFFGWINQQGWLNGIVSAELDRLPDQAGVEGDPTDIRLALKNSKGTVEIRNISLKHHHNALKHPRLPRLPEQCGISSPEISKQFNAEMASAWKEFLIKARKLKSNAKKFKELKAKDKKFIEENLYQPLITTICSFLNREANNPKNASAFFSFLTGNVNFYTIKNEDEKILIKYFIDLPKPQSFKLQYPYKYLTTFLMKFDNKWDVSLRLHTASSRFTFDEKSVPSTKFDVHCINLDKVIKIDKIPKK